MNSLRAVPGLADRRSSRPAHSSSFGSLAARWPEADDPRAVAPRKRLHRGLALLARRGPVVIGRPGHLRHRLVQHQRPRSPRMCGGEQRGHRASLEPREHRRLFGPGGIENRDDVVHLLLERRRARHGVRQPRPPAVEHDQSRERREPLEVPRDPRLLPVHLDLRHPARDVHEVDRAVADHLVGDVEVAAASVLSLWCHRPVRLLR